MEYKWIAHDEDGAICKYAREPELRKKGWWCGDNIFTVIGYGMRSSDWKSSLINLQTHDYKIEDGILMKVEKVNTNRHKDADALIAHANDMTLTLQFRLVGDKQWRDSHVGHDYEYRIKPKTKTVRFRNYLSEHGSIKAATEYMHAEDVKEWIGDWQEVEVEA